MVILFYFNSSVFCQKLIIDTVSTYAYGCFNERLFVYKTLVPDSTYLRLNGKNPWEKEALKYGTHHFVIAYRGKELHTFEDFKICFGEDCFQFNYPAYSYKLDKNVLIESLDDIYIKSVKNNSTFKPNELCFKFSDNTAMILNESTFSSETLLEELKIKLYNAGRIDIKVSSITYPYGEPREKCGQNIISFIDQEFQLYGIDKLKNLIKN